jgi:hypothetical protein
MKKKGIILLTLILVVQNLFTAKASAEIWAYEKTLPAAIYDLTMCIKLGETSACIYYSKECDAEAEFEKMFDLTGFAMTDIGPSNDNDYYILNLKTMGWDIPSYEPTSGTFRVNVWFEYRETPEEMAYDIIQVRKFVKANAKAVAKLSIAEKYEWIYKYLINNMDYDYYLENDSVYDALQYETGTCAAYAGLYYLIAREMGLPCKIAFGAAGDGDHVWNLVRLNKKWYYVDATWGEEYYKDYLFKAKDNVTTHELNKAVLNETDENGTIVFATKDYKIK